MAIASFNHFPQISEQLQKSLARTVKKVAKDMRKDAASFAPVDTGFLRDSIYVVTVDGSTYGSGVKQAGTLKANKKGIISRRRIQSQIKRRDRQKKQEAMLLVPVATPADELTAFVAVAAYYGIFLELGTRFMPAQPYFYPALRIAQVNLDGLLAVIAARLGTSGEVIGSVEDET